MITHDGVEQLLVRVAGHHVRLVTRHFVGGVSTCIAPVEDLVVASTGGQLTVDLEVRPYYSRVHTVLVGARVTAGTLWWGRLTSTAVIVHRNGTSNTVHTSTSPHDALLDSICRQVHAELTGL